MRYFHVFVTVKCVLRLLQGVSVLVYAMCWLLSSRSVSVNAEWKCLVTAKNKCGNCMPFCKCVGNCLMGLGFYQV